MGYRYYLYKIKKSDIENLRKIKTIEELEEKYGKYFALYDLGEEYVEFGKYYEYASTIYSQSEKLFKHQELDEEFDDYDPYICKKDILLGCAEFLRTKILEMYADLQNEKSADIFDERSREQRLISHCRQYTSWWQQNILDFTESNKLTKSWLYEHEIFNLVNAYKMFDENEYCLLFMGW